MEMKRFIKCLDEKVQKTCLAIIQQINETNEGFNVHFNKNDCSIIIENINEKPIDLVKLKEDFNK